MDRRDLAVLTGGILGTSARAGLAHALPSGAPWPWSTLTANLAGTLALALLVGWSVSLLERDDLRVRFLATGVLGSFTTFSAFAVEIAELGATARGAAYGVASVAVGVLCATVGVRAGTHLRRQVVA